MKKIIIIISTLFLFTCEDSVADALLDCECDIVESVRSFATNNEWEELSRIEATDDGYLILCLDQTLAEWTTEDNENRVEYRKSTLDCSLDSNL